MAISTLPDAPSTTDPTNFATKSDALIAALPTFITETNATAAAMNLNSTNDTSATSNAIGIGAKTFTVSTGKSFQPGMYLIIADTSAPSTNSMSGQVTSYNSSTGELAMSITGITGSGTKAAWTISQSSPVGSESSANKSTTLDTDKTSDIKYPSVKSVYDWVTGLFQTLANKDVTGGYAGLTLTKLNMLNNIGNIISFLTNNNTATRTYTFPDVDGTVYTTGNTLGTVSHYGGIPTGALMEHGSNSNGEYWRLASGIQICRVKGVGLTFDNSSNIGIYWIFPASFNNTPNVLGNLVGTLGTSKAITYVGSYAAASGGANVAAFSLAQFVSGDTTGNSMDAIAFGTWF